MDAGRGWLQRVVDRNVEEFAGTLEALESARREVRRRLGLEGGYEEEASIARWLVRLYAVRVGEAELLRRVRGWLEASRRGRGSADGFGGEGSEEG
ncbi:hypothetical protein [Thermofilum pendens]